MKTMEIAQKYGIEWFSFEKFVKDNNFPHSKSFSGINIEDHLVENAVKAYKVDLEKKQQEEQIRKQEEMKKRKAMSEMLITSGFTFDGYKITKYSGYISGDDAVSVERGMAIFGTGTNVKDKLMNSLVVIRRNALNELKEAAYALGCNAVIGVDFDYLTLDPQTANFSGGTTYQPYIFGVTANGNAVVIEKIDD